MLPFNRGLVALGGGLLGSHSQFLGPRNESGMNSKLFIFMTSTQPFLGLSDPPVVSLLRSVSCSVEVATVQVGPSVRLSVSHQLEVAQAYYTQWEVESTPMVKAGNLLF